MWSQPNGRGRNTEKRQIADANYHSNNLSETHQMKSQDARKILTTETTTAVAIYDDTHTTNLHMIVLFSVINFLC